LPVAPFGALLALVVVIAPVAASPATHDTAESVPAPMLIPGRPGPPDTTSRNRLLHAREQYALGLSLEREGGRPAAIAAYRNAAMLDPAIEDANYRAGMLFLAAGQVAEAVKCFTAEVAHHPGRVEAARELGLGLARMGEKERAIDQLVLLTRRLPKDGASWRALGFAYSVAGRGRDAEMALRRAIALPPELAAEHRDLGALLVTAGRIVDARAEYRRAMALDPKDATTWVNLGNLERMQRRFEPALAAYQDAETRDSTMRFALQGQVQTLHELGRDAEAGAVYRRLLKSQPGDLAARLDAIRLFDGLGRKDVALEIARDGVRYDRNSADARLLLGMALQSSGDTRTALAEMRHAEALFRNDAGRERARRLIRMLHSEAPDSLSVLFEADSLAHLPRLPMRPTPALPRGSR
jgi:tetratricopeptide (TPR) repeat protein